MRHHNPLRQRGIGPSLTCRVGICWIRTYGSPYNFLVSERRPHGFPRSRVGLGFYAEGFRIGSKSSQPCSRFVVHRISISHDWDQIKLSRHLFCVKFIAPQV